MIVHFNYASGLALTHLIEAAITSSVNRTVCLILTHNNIVRNYTKMQIMLTKYDIETKFELKKVNTNELTFRLRLESCVPWV